MSVLLRLAKPLMTVGLVAMICGCGLTTIKAAPMGGDDATAPSRQLLLVVAEDWQYTEARMQRYERDDANGEWTPVGESFEVSLGRKGLAWGRGVHGLALGAGPVKREGDGRAPAGVFLLEGGFAYDPAEVGKTRMPVRRVDAQLVCVDDEASPAYNTTLEQTGPAEWKSAENMLRPDGQYRLGAFVAHNRSPVVPGGGSCIFLHIWRARGAATSGCTSMDAGNLLTLLRWLDADKRPVLAQLTRKNYERLRSAWRLPEARP